MIQRTRGRSCSILASLLACAFASIAQAQTVTDFDLPAQSLEDALRAIAAHTNSNILFDRELVSGVSVKALKARVTGVEALKRVLDGTGLAFKYLDDKTVTIVPAGASMKTSHRGELAGTTAALALLAGQGAAAQEAATKDIRSEVLAEVVVTAQKREEYIQDVPMSISVITGEHLENFHSTQLADFAKYVPGVQVNNLGHPGLNSVTLRGITPIGPNQSVGVYIDDAPVGGSSFFALDSAMTADLLPYDIERIEVLRGPQGTLYGASGNAGLLKYVTRAPNLTDFELRAGTEVYDMASSGDAGWGGSLGLNAPLIEGKVAMRASYGYLRTPGYVDSIVLGIEDQNEVTQQSGRAALLWEASEDVSLKLAGLWQTIDSDGFGNLLLNNPSRTLFTGTPALDNQLVEPFTQDIGYYTATLDWALGWADFVSATSYSKTTSHIVQDVTSSFGAIWGGLAAFNVDLDLEKWTQEFRLASPSGARVEWLLGAFYTHEDNLTNQLASALTLAGDPVPVFDPFLIFDEPTQFREYALFSNLTYRFTERFDVSGGLRWARNDQDFHSISGGFINDLFGLSGDDFGDSSESVLTYSLSPRLRVNPDTMIYARVASGYRPGGPNVVVPGARPQADSDLLTSYEVGVKTELLERRVVIDAAVFRMDWQDIQVTVADSTGTFTFLDNGGEAWSQGVEVATLFRPVAALRLGVNAAYTDTELTELRPNASATFPGQPGDSLPLVPKWSASATADYEFPLRAWRGRVGAGYRYVDERLSGFDSDVLTVLQDSYKALDLNAGVFAENWTVRLFATNVTDEEGQMSLGQILTNPAFYSATLLPPRTVGLGLDVKF